MCVSTDSTDERTEKNKNKSRKRRRWWQRRRRKKKCDRVEICRNKWNKNVNHRLCGIVSEIEIQNGLILYNYMRVEKEKKMNDLILATRKNIYKKTGSGIRTNNCIEHTHSQNWRWIRKKERKKQHTQYTNKQTDTQHTLAARQRHAIRAYVYTYTQHIRSAFFYTQHIYAYTHNRSIHGER